MILNSKKKIGDYRESSDFMSHEKKQYDYTKKIVPLILRVKQRLKTETKIKSN